jgi:hypothetical protein
MTECGISAINRAWQTGFEAVLGDSVDFEVRGVVANKGVE